MNRHTDRNMTAEQIGVLSFIAAILLFSTIALIWGGL
jgi:hypothetical protein